MDLSHKTVLILGAQKSGLAAAGLAHWAGAKVRISDQSPREKMSGDVLGVVTSRGWDLETGAHTEEFVSGCDLVILSPGVRLDAKPACWARARGIPIFGEIEFASQFCTAPIIAVTGSNGKTTTVNLMQNVLKAAGYRVRLCGNVGMPFSDFAREEADYFVLEVSSFQMESLLSSEEIREIPQAKGFCPHIAAVLNFSANHLDRHADMEEYFQAKTRIFLNQTQSDYAVLNAQSEALRALAAQLRAQVKFFNCEGEAGYNPNQLAVCKIAEILKIDRQVCEHVFREFKGVEHRMEFVRFLDGVNYINDSKSTTVESGRWALSLMPVPGTLICGGKDKNLDFSVLREIVKQKVKRMIVIGEASQKIEGIFSDVVSVVRESSLESAINTARAGARAGEWILLSPMCASFDMFKNFEHRGEVFKNLVSALKE